MTVIKINEFLMRNGDAKLLVCPNCKGHEFAVVTIRQRRKVALVKLACLAEKCRKRPPLDVMSGFVTE